MAQEEHSRIAKNALDRVVEMALSNQLESAEKLTVDIEGDPAKLIRGEVDSVKMQGEGLVTSQNLRFEEVVLKADSIAINLINAALGKIKLTQPTDASVEIVVTESDLNRALNSEYLHEQLRQLSIPLNQEKASLTLDLQQASCELPGDGKVILTVESDVQTGDRRQTTEFTIILRVDSGGAYIALEQGHYQEGKDLPFNMTVALLSKASDLLQIRRLRLKDLSLQIQNIEVEIGKLILSITAHAEQLPSL